MNDLHTHILPKMDDGAKSVEESFAMLYSEREQGIKTLALTPHFYLWREDVQCFLTRREMSLKLLLSAYLQLDEQTKKSFPSVYIGAEVAWVESLLSCEGMDKLCYRGTDYILLELPMEKWDRRLPQQVQKFEAETGLKPVLAHFDRYYGHQDSELVEDILSLGYPMQVSAGSFLQFFERKRSVRLLKWGAMPISDCHSMNHRRPNLAEAKDALTKKEGAEIAALMDKQDDFLLDLTKPQTLQQLCETYL